MKKIELPPHTYRRNERGLIEAVCLETGRVLLVQASEVDILAGRMDRVTRIDTPDGPVYIDKVLNYDLVGKLKEFPYSQILGDLLCEKVAHGAGLKKACEEMNIPYSVVKRWEREQEEFRAGLACARRDGAEYHHGEILEIARTQADTKTQVETLKWAAEVSDPEKYGKKTKISGDPTSPVGFIISTGITRDVAETTAPDSGEKQVLSEVKKIEGDGVSEK